MAPGPRSAVLREVETLYRLGASGGLSDGQILRRFLDGGGDVAESAFACLVRRHGPLVLGVCRRMLSGPDAEDAFQAVFLVLLRRARALARSEDITGWLHNVAVRTAWESRRRNARRRAREIRAMAHRPTESRPIEPNDDLRAVLDAELARLPTRYRDPIIQCDLEGLGRIEAAQRLGIAPGTLSSRLARGRRLLRDRLIRRGITPAVGALAALSRTADAALPVALERAAIGSALRLMTGAGAIPVAVSELAEGVLKAMLLTRLKVGFSLFLIVGLSAGMAAGLTAAQDAKPEAAAAPTPEPAAPPVAEPMDGPREVEIIVRAKDTGRPLADASIRALVDFEHRLLKTDRDGRARIDRSGQTFGDRLSIDIWADGYVQQRYFFSQSDSRSPKIPERFEVALFPGTETLGGRVVDEQGRPIAGVKVEIWGYLGELKDKHELAYKVDAITDERGDWRCRCFRTMKFAYLYLSHPDYLSDDSAHPRSHGSPSGPPNPDSQPLEKLRDFSDVQTMARGVEVAGQVLNDRNQPVAGAEVGWLKGDGNDTFHSEMPTARTDARGLFRFPHARPGKVLIQIKATGYAPALKSAEARAGMDPVTIDLKRPRTLAGRVIDSAGRPIVGAIVNTDTWRGSRALGVFFKTDADGRFRWDEAPDDSLTINATQIGYEHIIQRRVSPDEGEITLTLRKTLVIWGRVRGAEPGVRIERAEVEVGTEDAKTGAFTWRPDSRSWVQSGMLQVTLDAENQVNYRFRIRARGHEPFESRTFRSDEGQVEYDIKLTKAADDREEVVSGIVLRPDGQPLAGAEVALTYAYDGRRHLPSVSVEDGKIRHYNDDASVKTDARGRFSIIREPDPAGGNFGVVVAHPEFFAEVPRAAFEEAKATIRAQPWGRVEGIIRINGEPAPGAEVRYFADRLGNPGVLKVHDGGMATADPLGHFVLNRVLPGDVRVARGFGSGGNFKGWSNGTLIQVHASATARAEVGGKGRPVIARIVPPKEFDPSADYTIYSEFEIESARPNIPYPKDGPGPRDINWANRWWTSDEGRDYRRHWFRFGQAKLQSDGTIRADDVPPGTYRMTLSFSADPIYGPTATPERIASATQSFTIPEGTPTDEPFDLGTLRPVPNPRLSPTTLPIPKGP